MGFIDSVFGENDSQKFLQAPEFEEAKRARARLEEISNKPLPAIPLQGIADVPKPTQETQLARGAAKDLLAPTEQQDIFSLPEVQGIIFEATQRGDLLANRLGRGLQKTGGASSTTGRDVLGRVSTDVSKQLAASLAPFAESQRNRAFADVQRRQNLIPLLAQMGLTQEQREQATEQLKLSAKFAQELGISQQEINQLIPQLRFLANLKPQSQVITDVGRSGLIEQAGAIAPIFAGYATGAAGGGGFSGGLIGAAQGLNQANSQHP